MSGFIEGEDRHQSTLFPERLDDCIAEDHGAAIRLVCREFVMLCRKLNLFTQVFVAIDGSKFKAVNKQDRNFTKAKMKRRLQQIDESIKRYQSQLASADRQDPAA